MPAISRRTDDVRTVIQQSHDGASVSAGIAAGLSLALFMLVTTVYFIKYRSIRRHIAERHLAQDGRCVEAPRLWEVGMRQSKGYTAVVPTEWGYLQVRTLQSYLWLAIINDKHPGSRSQSIFSANLPDRKPIRR